MDQPRERPQDGAETVDTRELEVRWDELERDGAPSRQHAALAVLAAALERFGEQFGLGGLDGVTLSFAGRPCALVVDRDGTIRARIGEPDELPGALLAGLRRSTPSRGEPAT